MEKPSARVGLQRETPALLVVSATIAARDRPSGRHVPLLRLTVTLGLRIGEVTGLTWEDFDKDANLLHVRRQWTKYHELTKTKTKAGESDHFR